VARFLVAVFLGGLLLAPAPAAGGWPAPPFGRVIVQGFQTAWVVPAHGAVVTLGGAESVDWSAQFRLLAVTRRDRLAVLDARGRTRWSHSIAALAGAPRWSTAPPARLAFLAGRAIRVVDAAGRPVLRLGRARDVAPAWRPGLDQLAFVRPDGEIVIVSRTGRRLAHWRPGRKPVSLSWTGNAQHLVVSLRYAVVVLAPDLRVESWLRSPPILSAVAAPVGTRFALLTVHTTASGVPLATLELRDAARRGMHSRLAASWTLGGRVVWSPDARSLIVARPVLRDWLVIDVRTHAVRRRAPPRQVPPAAGFTVPVAWR
jgi:hypothetical protein